MKLLKNAVVITACLSLFILCLVSCKKSNDGITSNPVTYKNHIAYIYKQNSTDAAAYKSLMEANNCGVTLFDMSQLGSIDFKKFDLVVIGNNSSIDAYDFAGITGSIAGKPVLMIGEGGLHFGEMVNAVVNWSNTSGGTRPITMIAVDSANPVYKTPKKIIIPANRQITLFNQGSFGEAFYAAAWINVSSVEEIGQASSSNSNEYSVTFEKNKWGFFGYYDNVNAMTQAGKDFMVNLSYYIGKLSL
jgi:hypothetical protein